jgi:hypothetical protein
VAGSSVTITSPSEEEKTSLNESTIRIKYHKSKLVFKPIRKITEKKKIKQKKIEIKKGGDLGR